MTIELRVLCEGHTEQGFITQVLAPHLREFGVYPRAEPLARGHYGSVSFDSLYSWIKRDVGRSKRNQYVTTMVDLYALRDFPGGQRQASETGRQYAERIEAGMAERLNNERFVPYIQVHEFEAMVFVDLDTLLEQFPDGEAAGAPAELRAQVGKIMPEDVNDGPTTAPSKRLIQAVPLYRSLKAIAGPAIAASIGLPRIRYSCPHLDEWVSKLENLRT